MQNTPQCNGYMTPHSADKPLLTPNVNSVADSKELRQLGTAEVDCPTVTCSHNFERMMLRSVTSVSRMAVKFVPFRRLAMPQSRFPSRLPDPGTAVIWSTTASSTKSACPASSKNSSFAPEMLFCVS